eukprot:GHVU01215749.1.p1 GENE.GHVU01215749.1~~GHVU01215749.1.p1  ORF type:complete len:106 (-),score=5.65 GHVU01215749.1:536-853(-)
MTIDYFISIVSHVHAGHSSTRLSGPPNRHIIMTYIPALAILPETSEAEMEPEAKKDPRRRGSKAKGNSGEESMKLSTLQHTRSLRRCNRRLPWICRAAVVVTIQP